MKYPNEYKKYSVILLNNIILNEEIYWNNIIKKFPNDF